MTSDALMEKLADYGADMQGIKERFLGDMALYQQCFRLFIEDENFDALGKAIAEKNCKAAFTASHTLKGVVGNMGLKKIYAPICEIVELVRGASEMPEGVKEKYEMAEREWQYLRQLV